MPTVTITATTRFTAHHNWPDAPDHRAYLRNLHRHVFHVEVEVYVPKADDDRTVEFHDLKDVVDARLNTLAWSHATLEGMSCESMAASLGSILAKRYTMCKVKISEDGENWATVYYP